MSVIVSGDPATVIVQRATRQSVIARESASVVVDRPMRSAFTLRTPRSTVAARDIRMAVLTAARGPQGATGPQGSITDLQQTAGAVVSGHRALRHDTAGAVRHAGSDQAQPWPVLGIGLNAALAGETVNVRSAGLLSFSGWAWTPGLPVFLGLDGALTHSPPTAGFLLSLGYAVSATGLLIRIGRPLLRN